MEKFVSVTLNLVSHSGTLKIRFPFKSDSPSLSAVFKDAADEVRQINDNHSIGWRCPKVGCPEHQLFRKKHFPARFFFGD